MTAAILASLFWAQAAGAQTLPANAEKKMEIREAAGNVNTMLGAIMTGMEKDGKAELSKKLEVIKVVRKAMGEETLLRLELVTELQKMQMAIQYMGYRLPQDDASGDANRLETLKKIEKALEGTVDKKQLKLIREKAESGRVKGALSSLRSAIQVFYGDTEGTFPKDLAELAQRAKYIQMIPYVMPPGHSKSSNAVKLVSGVRDMADLIRKVDDAGGWLYVNDRDSKLWGSVIINCSHADVNNSKTFMYSY